MYERFNISLRLPLHLFMEQDCEQIVMNKIKECYSRIISSWTLKFWMDPDILEANKVVDFSKRYEDTFKHRTSFKPKDNINTNDYVLFEVQEDSTDIGSSWPDNRGANANFVSTHSGSTKTGRSKQELDSSDIQAAAANFRIVELSKDPDNSDTTAANCNFLVRINEGLYYGNTAGI